MRRGLLLFCALVAVCCERDAGVDLDGEPLYSQQYYQVLSSTSSVHRDDGGLGRLMPDFSLCRFRFSRSSRSIAFRSWTSRSTPSVRAWIALDSAPAKPCKIVE